MKRTGSIVCVTVAKYATMYIEAETPDEAKRYAEKYGHLVDPYDFEDSEVEVHSWEAYTTEPHEYMDEIWVGEGDTVDIDDYMDEWEEDDDER